VTEPGRIRVLVVDDHGVVRRGLRGYLELLDDMEVVGEAENGLRGVELAEELEPDVVLMDLVMPELDGIGAIARIKASRPAIQVVALTSFIEEEKVTAALEAGASGFILKDADADDVAAAIRAAHNDEIHLDPAAARILARGLRNRSTAAPADGVAATRRSRPISGSPNGRPGPTSATSSASSALPAGHRRPCMRSSASSSRAPADGAASQAPESSWHAARRSSSSTGPG
jgi:DNA-binding NarL/FixJ family response regulator